MLLSFLILPLGFEPDPLSTNGFTEASALEQLSPYSRWTGSEVKALKLWPNLTQANQHLWRGNYTHITIYDLSGGHFTYFKAFDRTFGRLLLVGVHYKLVCVILRPRIFDPFHKARQRLGCVELFQSNSALKGSRRRFLDYTIQNFNTVNKPLVFGITSEIEGEIKMS